MFLKHRPHPATWVAAVAAALFAGSTLGQAPVAPPKHQSALRDYQGYRDEKPANWRDVNDTMAVLGGHNAHLLEIERSVAAFGTVLEIDRAAGRVRIDGDAIKPLGWPAGIAFWQLKSPSLADQIKPGERIAFTLEKDGDVYRITGFARDAAPASKPVQAADPHAGHRQGVRK